MRLVPYEQFTLSTSLSPQQFVARLNETVKSPTLGNIWEGGPLYQGWVLPSRFEISPASYYRQEFLPIIRGRIQPTATGSSVAVELQMQGWVRIFLLFWVVPLLLLVIGTLCSNLGGRDSLGSLLVGVALLLFGHSVSLIAFQGQAQRVKQFFYNLVATTPTGGSAGNTAHPPVVLRHPTERLPLLWGGESPLPPAAEGAEHETQRLPPPPWSDARGD
ncbi:MAG: SoxR reducing system RseC family protein [Chloroflexota bacterium]|nr:SoxR reducing system RseC family protein [Chloroflexota bacterium]